MKENVKGSEGTNLSTCLVAVSLLNSDHLPNTYFQPTGSEPALTFPPQK